jgi:hypothetical protein
MMTFKTLSRVFAGAAGLALAAGAASAQQTFPTPEAAASALVEAARAGEKGFVERIFGPGSRAVISSGDADEDKRRLSEFNEAAAAAMTLSAPDATTRVMNVGKNPFAFPVPIVKKGDAWAFDVVSGKQEILNRAIGFNEASAIEACRTYVAAQREYFRLDRDEDEVQEYAQRIVSSPGKHDGLYWDAASQADRSPLDGRLADSVLSAVRSGKRAPYHGYFFRILKAQGPAAPGGAFSYVINGRMIAGFGLVAWPAEWGRTGVMTFICNQQGKVYQADLGARTSRIVGKMTRYDPDATWTRVD